jgi:hypothetical protein
MMFKSLSSKLIPKIKLKTNSEDNLSQSQTPSPPRVNSLSASPEPGRKRSISDILLGRTPRNSFEGMSLDDLGNKKI